MSNQVSWTSLGLPQKNVDEWFSKDFIGFIQKPIATEKDFKNKAGRDTYFTLRGFISKYNSF